MPGPSVSIGAVAIRRAVGAVGGAQAGGEPGQQLAGHVRRLGEQLGELGACR